MFDDDDFIVDEQENTPNQFFKKPYTPTKRKFPGPAGLIHLRSDNLSISNADESLIPMVSQDLPNSQDGYDFSIPPWVKMRQELDDDNLLHTYNIAYIKDRAENRILKDEKVPFLAAVINSIKVHRNNCSIDLRDPTGEMTALVTSEVYEDNKDDFLIGSVVIFTNFGILTTIANNHYLTMTVNNFHAVYSVQHEKSEGSVKITLNEKSKWDKFNIPKKGSESCTKFNYSERSSIENNMFDDEFDFASLDMDSFEPMMVSTSKCKKNIIEVDTKIKIKEEEAMRKLNQNKFEKRPDNVSRTSIVEECRNKNKDNSKFSKMVFETDMDSIKAGTVKSVAPLGSTSNRLNKFRFYAKDVQIEPNAIPATISPPSSSQLSFSADDSKSSQILQEVFDGMDVESIFDDF